MGATGIWDNAGSESLLSTFRHECYYRHVCATNAYLIARVGNWMRFYNSERRRSLIGMLSPVDYEHTLKTNPEATHITRPATIRPARGTFTVSSHPSGRGPSHRPCRTKKSTSRQGEPTGRGRRPPVSCVPEDRLNSRDDLVKLVDPSRSPKAAETDVGGPLTARVSIDPCAPPQEHGRRELPWPHARDVRRPTARSVDRDRPTDRVGPTRGVGADPGVLPGYSFIRRISAERAGRGAR